MAKIMSKPIFPGDRKTLPVFQEGILRNNKALDVLHRDVIEYNMTYIINYLLNQDILKNFFGAIRSREGLHDHPSPKEYRIRKYMMGEFEILILFLFAFIFFLSARNTEFFNGTGNVKIDDEILKKTLNQFISKLKLLENICKEKNKMIISFENNQR